MSWYGHNCPGLKKKQICIGAMIVFAKISFLAMITLMFPYMCLQALAWDDGAQLIDAKENLTKTADWSF